MTRPRIALTTALLAIPPTYFVTQHAALLAAAGRIDPAVYPLAAEILDPPPGVPIRPAIPAGAGGWSVRRRLAGIGLARQRRQVVSFGPDLVHQHHATWSPGAVSAARSTRAPLLVTVHGADVLVASGTARSVMARWHRANVSAALRAARTVLAVSGYLADVARRAGADPGRLAVHHQGIDTEMFVPPPSRESGPPRVLVAGTLTRRKRVDLAIEAVRCLQADRLFTDVQLDILGDGPLRAALQAQAAGMPAVRFLGARPQAQVRAAMAHADLLILPSHDEAAGLVLLEAQASGTPVVVTAGDGKAEMLLDGITGAVVAADADGSQLASAARPFLEASAGDDRALVRACRDFVVRERSLTVSARVLMEFYEDALR